MKVAIIGAGLAGSECAWILASHYKVQVTLFEMKSKNPTPAQSEPHHFAELVCSNSLKSKSRLNPAGLLKQEMKALGSLIMAQAWAAEVPAGETLAVDREKFSGGVTAVLKGHPNVTVVEAVVPSLSWVLEQAAFDAVVIATGPLTADGLASDLRELTGSDSLYFYDAIAPIINGDSIDMTIAFKANRKSRTHAYEDRLKLKALTTSAPDEALANEKGASNSTAETGVSCTAEEEEEGDYINLPLDKQEYDAFVAQVLAGDKVPFHDFEEPKFFNGCQPIEVLAESGPRTLSFGPMKPRGITDPRTGRWPHAVVQLRKEKLGDGAYNMVGFQTRLTWTAQRAIFKTLPGLADAEFFRMGSMHRNTYLVSPLILAPDHSIKAAPQVYLAGQVMGVEGYLESAAMGLFIGHVVGHKVAYGQAFEMPPAHCTLGTLTRYTLKAEAKNFSPMNVNWGLFDELTERDLDVYGHGVELPKSRNVRKLDKSVKRHILANRAEKAFAQWLARTRLAGVFV